MLQKVDLILASGSPRRREILTQAGFDFTVMTSQAEENIAETDPEKKVRLLSQKKAEAVYSRLKEKGAPARTGYSDGKSGRAGVAVIGADTLVACDGKALGKPGSREEAVRMLHLLQGRSHDVHTGVTVCLFKDGKDSEFTFEEKTRVQVAVMTQQDIEEYVDTGEPYDKAGGYGIQGRFAVYVEGIEGDYNTVVGFPLAGFCREMRSRGLM